MIRLYQTKTEFIDINEKDIESIDQSMGDKIFVYDFCGNIWTGFICKDCLFNDKVPCGIFQQAKIIIPPLSLCTVIFTDQSQEDFLKWEQILNEYSVIATIKKVK